MKTSALVSIIIPCYKQAHFLGEAIESALRQTHAPVEVIVVDDGSPDNTGEVAARYPEVRYLRQENAGLPAARNAGMRASRGEFLIFLDSDDRLYPRAAEINLQYLSERPDCAFSSGLHFLIAADGAPLHRSEQLHVTREHYWNLLQTNFIGCPATVMYRRAMLEELGGFDVSMKSVEDYQVYLDLARRHPIFNHQELIAEYRLHGANMSANHARMLEYAVRALNSQWEHIKDDRRLVKAYRRGLRRKKKMYHCELLVEESRRHARAGEKRQALRKMLTLLCYYPADFAVHAARKMRCVLLGSGAKERIMTAPSSVNEK